MASINDAYNGLLSTGRPYENGSFFVKYNPPSVPTMAQAAAEIADQHRFRPLYK